MNGVPEGLIDPFGKRGWGPATAAHLSRAW
jgi:hypothetical protein